MFENYTMESLNCNSYSLELFGFNRLNNNLKSTEGIFGTVALVSLGMGLISILQSRGIKKEKQEIMKIIKDSLSADEIKYLQGYDKSLFKDLQIIKNEYKTHFLKILNDNTKKRYYPDFHFSTNPHKFERKKDFTEINTFDVELEFGYIIGSDFTYKPDDDVDLEPYYFENDEENDMKLDEDDKFYNTSFKNFAIDFQKNFFKHKILKNCNSVIIGCTNNYNNLNKLDDCSDDNMVCVSTIIDIEYPEKMKNILKKILSKITKS